MDYIVLTSNSTSGLASLVITKLQEGYTITGGVATTLMGFNNDTVIYSQAVFKLV